MSPSVFPSNRTRLFHQDKPFPVADTGGGTADLITYTLESQEPTLKVKGATPARVDFMALPSLIRNTEHSCNL